MCKNQKWIVNKVTKQKVLVRCGKCPACLQAKANSRTLRINLQSKYNVPTGYITYFVTLGYDNKHVPFILKSHYEEFINKLRPTLPVFRMSDKGISKGKKISDKKYSRRRPYPFKRPLRTASIIDEFDNYPLHSNDELYESSYDTFIDKFRLQYYSHEIDVNKLDELRSVRWIDGKRHYNLQYEKVGVLYYKDIQNFIKRLRIYLLRKYGIKDKISFYSTGEYGPTSKRPHYHILFHIPANIFTQFKDSVINCWQFENLYDTKKQERQLKIADGAANYVSSYVNCSSYIHPFLHEFRPFRPSHTYSQGYGILSNFCSLPSILVMSERRKFTYKRTIAINGIKSVVDLPLPSYVVRRYFPKFKGDSRLTGSEIFGIITDVKRLSIYKKCLDYSDDDINAIKIMFRNSILRYCEILGIPLNNSTIFSYAHDYVTTWSRYYSFLNLLDYESLNSLSDLLYHFINWSEKKDSHEFVKIALKYVESPQEDINLYPLNLSKDKFLEMEFINYDKMKKVKNNLYSINSNV